MRFRPAIFACSLRFFFAASPFLPPLSSFHLFAMDLKTTPIASTMVSRAIVARRSLVKEEQYSWPRCWMRITALWLHPRWFSVHERSQSGRKKVVASAASWPSSSSSKTCSQKTPGRWQGAGRVPPNEIPIMLDRHLRMASCNKCEYAHTLIAMSTHL